MSEHDDGLEGQLSTASQKALRHELWRQNRAAVKRGDYAAALSIWKTIMSEEREADLPLSQGHVTWLGSSSFRGWLKPDMQGCPVSLVLNGRPVYSANACQRIKVGDHSMSSGFRLPVRRLWQYLGRGDLVQVYGPDGSPLPLEALGSTFTPWLKRKSRTAKLFEKLDSGFLLNKLGKLQLPLNLDVERLDAIMATFEATRTELATKFDLNVFIFYGTLLGCVRQADFIPHDDDVDVVYISKCRGPAAVKSEFMSICQHLRSSGWGVRAKPFGAKVWRPGSKRSLSIGLHYGWSYPDGSLGVAYGHHGPECDSPGDSYTRASIGEYEVKIPDNSESILDMLYTPTWRVPDSGFSHHIKQRKIPIEFHLTDTEIDSLST